MLPGGGAVGSVWNDSPSGQKPSEAGPPGASYSAESLAGGVWSPTKSTG